VNGPVAPATPPATAFPLRAELARKAFHFATAIVPVAWALDWISTPALRVVLAVAVAVALLMERGRRKPAPGRLFTTLFGAMLRPHEAAGLTGATWLALAMLAAVLLLPAPAALVALWAGVFGDGLAAIIGRLVSRRGTSDPSAKTVAGSLACLAATAAGAIWLAEASLAQALLIGGAAAAAERPRLALDDNVRVTLAAGLAAWVLLAR